MKHILQHSLAAGTITVTTTFSGAPAGSVVWALPQSLVSLLGGSQHASVAVTASTGPASAGSKVLWEISAYHNFSSLSAPAAPSACLPNTALRSPVSGRHFALCTATRWSRDQAVGSAAAAGGVLADLSNDAEVDWIRSALLLPCADTAFPQFTPSGVRYGAWIGARQGPASSTFRWDASGADVSGTASDWKSSYPAGTGRCASGFSYAPGNGALLFAPAGSNREGRPGGGGWMDAPVNEYEPQFYLYQSNSAGPEPPDAEALCSQWPLDVPGPYGAFGTVNYMAPELLPAYDGAKAAKRSPASDIYALGFLLWQLMTRREQYTDAGALHLLSAAGGSAGTAAVCASMHKYVEGGHRPSFEAEVVDASTPEYFKRIVQACWVTDAGRRPSAAEVVAGLRSGRWDASIPSPGMGVSASGAAGGAGSGSYSSSGAAASPPKPAATIAAPARPRSPSPERYAMTPFGLVRVGGGGGGLGGGHLVMTSAGPMMIGVGGGGFGEGGARVALTPHGPMLIGGGSPFGYGGYGGSMMMPGGFMALRR